MALRWNVQRGVVVIPKSTSESHLAGNLAAVGRWIMLATSSIFETLCYIKRHAMIGPLPATPFTSFETHVC